MKGVSLVILKVIGVVCEGMGDSGMIVEGGMCNWKWEEGCWKGW